METLRVTVGIVLEVEPGTLLQDVEWAVTEALNGLNRRFGEDRISSLQVKAMPIVGLPKIDPKTGIEEAGE